MALDLVGEEREFNSGLFPIFVFVCKYYMCFFYHNVPPSGSVAGIVHGADLGSGLVFKVQPHILNTHMTSPWEKGSKEEKKSIKPTGITCLQAIDASLLLNKAQGRPAQAAHCSAQKTVLWFCLLTLYM